ncbi:hypothetical protein AXK60_02175 [Tsukamurella pseudospumae]|uniref:HTH araC/xylS-type domain-containing protein n=1 Tax=Tsukamurella pseudospumae TaxID=239498 RepID=A0A138AWA2_9ACTN|nr:hypothetical protein AXK61_05860 [Tsukamurella pseudospumae]KXP14714.1 hypothetical protein AXK60_02175 [Tsukamurella pseudospumae]
MVSHESDLGRWTQVLYRPDPLLAPFVRSIEGFDESTPRAVRRIEPAAAEAVIIFGFGDPVVVSPTAAAAGTPMSSFVVPLRDRPLYVDFAGSQAGVQANLTPLGARAILGTPLGDVPGAVDTGEFRPDLDALADRLADTRDWIERCRIVESALRARVAIAGDPAPQLVAACRAITAGGSVQEVADAVGWSRQHLHRRFAREFGHAPKVVHRLVRFGRAADLLGSTDLVDVATRCGYYDQAHLSREFREFAGCSPQQFADRRLPDLGGFEDVTFVQDAQ